MSDCSACDTAVVLDELALVVLDEAEIGVIACPKHLERVVRAVEFLEHHEHYQPAPEPIDGLDAMLARRVTAQPERRS